MRSTSPPGWHGESTRWPAIAAGKLLSIIVERTATDVILPGGTPGARSA